MQKGLIIIMQYIKRTLLHDYNYQMFNNYILERNMLAPKNAPLESVLWCSHLFSSV